MEIHFRKIILQVFSVERTIVGEEVSIQDKMIEPHAVGIVVATVYVYLLISVVEAAASIGFWINPLSIASGYRAVGTKTLVFF